jgi:hypothetical protein
MKDSDQCACRSSEPRDCADEYGRSVGNADDERPQELRTKVYGERVLYDSPWVRLALVDVEPPDGHRFEHHVVRLFRGRDRARAERAG